MTQDDGQAARPEVAQLYALLPGQFTAARDHLAASLRTAGDRAGSAQIKALRRPTVSAWLVNLAVRREPAAVEQLLAIGDELRDERAPGAFSEIARRRRALLADLSRRAVAAAAQQGQAVADAAVREFESTLDAAVVDPRAAAVVRSGRLDKALNASGFDVLDDMFGGTEAPSRPHLTLIAGGQGAEPVRAQRSGRTDNDPVVRAQTRAAEALEVLAQASQAASEADAALTAAQLDIERAQATRVEAERAVELARADLAAAQTRAAAARRRADLIARRLQDAQRKASLAQQQMEQLVRSQPLD